MSKRVLRFWIWLVVALTPGFVAADSLRDPTQPLGHVAHKAAQTKLELQAVFLRGKKSQVVINGRYLEIGDEVAGARVVAIDGKSVIYTREGKTRRLALRESVIERR